MEGGNSALTEMDFLLGHAWGKEMAILPWFKWEKVRGWQFAMKRFAQKFLKLVLLIFVERFHDFRRNALIKFGESREVAFVVTLKAINGGLLINGLNFTLLVVAKLNLFGYQGSEEYRWPNLLHHELFQSPKLFRFQNIMHGLKEFPLPFSGFFFVRSFPSLEFVDHYF